MTPKGEVLLNKIKFAGPPLEADVDELFQVLQNPAMMRAMWAILNSSDESLTVLGNMDFTTDEGVKNAIKVQARATIYSQVAKELIEFATADKPEKEEEKKNDN